MQNSKVIVDFEIRIKKLASLPILVLDSRSRFTDLSFHSQLCLKVTWKGLYATAVHFSEPLSPPKLLSCELSSLITQHPLPRHTADTHRGPQLRVMNYLEGPLS